MQCRHHEYALQNNIGQNNAESTRYDECAVPKMHGDTVRDPIVPEQNDGRSGNDIDGKIVKISYDAIRYGVDSVVRAWAWRKLLATLLAG